MIKHFQGKMKPKHHSLVMLWRGLLHVINVVLTWLKGCNPPLFFTCGVLCWSQLNVDSSLLRGRNCVNLFLLAVWISQLSYRLTSPIFRLKQFLPLLNLFSTWQPIFKILLLDVLNVVWSIIFADLKLKRYLQMMIKIIECFMYLKIE